MKSSFGKLAEFFVFFGWLIMKGMWLFVSEILYVYIIHRYTTSLVKDRLGWADTGLPPLSSLLGQVHSK